MRQLHTKVNLLHIIIVNAGTFADKRIVNFIAKVSLERIG